MEKDLAEYANSMAKSYITDKDLEEGILLKTQVPSNIDKTPVVDNFMSKLLANNRELYKDKSLAIISKKVTDIYAPLSKVWELMESYKNGENSE